MVISCDDTKTMETAIEVLLTGYLNTLRAVDIEDLLNAEFENYTMAQENLHWVIKEFKTKKGLL